MTDVAIGDRFDVGRVINRLFGVLGRNFVSFLLLSLLFVGAPLFLAGIADLAFSKSGASAADAFGPTLLVGLLALLVSVCANAVLQGAVIHETVSDLAGRPASLGESVSVGLKHVLPLIGIGIISGIGVGFATLLLIVPGVLLALAWCVAVPAAVMEQTGVFGSLERSLVLTRNHRGSIFLLALVFLVLSMVIGLVPALLSFATAGLGVTPTAVVIQSLLSAIAQAGTAMIGSAGVASVYYELRQIKDGVGAQQLAAVFD